MFRRSIAGVLALVLTAGSLAGCGRSEPPPPVDDSRHSAAPTSKPGMSTTEKVVLLGGAAALYYLYKHHQAASAQSGPDSQYYLSKNGRVYYRDAEHRAHWVTPPTDGIKVPESEAAAYREFQGYDGKQAGRDLSNLSNDAE